jgi:hypothetical protein
VSYWFHKNFLKSISQDKTDGWWLRTPGVTNEYTMYVSPNGGLDYTGTENIISQNMKPAMIVDISK